MQDMRDQYVEFPPLCLYTWREKLIALMKENNWVKENPLADQDVSLEFWKPNTQPQSCPSVGFRPEQIFANLPGRGDFILLKSPTDFNKFQHICEFIREN